MMLRVLLIFLISGISSGLVAQTCKEQVLDALSHMREFDDSMTVHIRYNIQTAFVQKDSVQEATVEIFSKGKNFKMVGGNISIYQNEKYNLTFIEDRKMIFITHAKQQQLMPWESIGILQDSLVKQATVLECERQCKDDGANLEIDHITLKLDAKARFAMDISKIEYWIDPAESEVHRFKITYDGDKTFDHIMVGIEQYERNYSKEIFDQDIQRAFKEPDNIESIYKDYLIRDNR